MKKVVVISLAGVSAIVWLVFCLFAEGLIAYSQRAQQQLPTGQGTEVLSDLSYLECCQPILVRGGEISDSISQAAASQFPVGFCRVIADVRSTGSLLKLKENHALCPAPGNEALQTKTMRRHIDSSYQESLRAVELYAQYCDEADWLDSRLMDQAMTHMQQADWHMDQANLIIHSFYRRLTEQTMGLDAATAHLAPSTERMYECGE
jgi:hypothetical protein